MYECKLVVIVSESVSKEANKLYKKHKIVDDFGDEAEGAVVFFGTDVYYMIIGSDYLTHNTLAHEIFHATVRITEDRDITDEETQAWLAGHLTDMVYKFLDKKKLQVEHG
jgi:hypothetical protein